MTYHDILDLVEAQCRDDDQPFPRFRKSVVLDFIAEIRRLRAMEARVRAPAVGLREWKCSDTPPWPHDELTGAAFRQAASYIEDILAASALEHGTGRG